MTQPAIYNRATSFATDQAAAPTTPLTGASFDAEFNAIKTTLDQVLANLALIQRDDTHIANQTVGRDQLDTTITLGFNVPQAWATAHNYVANADTVFQSAKFYRCLISHTSGVFATDLAAVKWELIADFTTAISSAVNVSFTPAQGIAATNVQAAIEEAVTDLNGLDFLVKTATGNLSAERVVTDTATVAWDWATAGAAKANVPDSAIVTVKINDGAILTAKISDAQVTFAKIQNISTGTLLGRTTAAAGVVEQLTAGTSLTLGGGVLNANLATSGEATAGADNIKVMTPLRTQQAIDNARGFAYSFTAAATSTTSHAGTAYTYSYTVAPDTSNAYRSDDVTVAYAAKTAANVLRVRYQCESTAADPDSVTPPVLALFRDISGVTTAIAWAGTIDRNAPGIRAAEFIVTVPDTASHTYTIGYLNAGATTVPAAEGRRLFQIEELKVG